MKYCRRRRIFALLASHFHLTHHFCQFLYLDTSFLESSSKSTLTPVEWQTPTYVYLHVFGCESRVVALCLARRSGFFRSLPFLLGSSHWLPSNQRAKCTRIHIQTHVNTVNVIGRWAMNWVSRQMINNTHFRFWEQSHLLPIRLNSL